MADFARRLVAEIPALRRYARALTGDASEADDVVQDCLERAWSRAHLFRPDRDLRVWLYAILHNGFIDDRRRARRRPAPAPLGDAGDRLAAPPVQDLDRAMADLDRALDALPDAQRAVLVLVVVEGLSYADAARALDVPPGTVMSRLHRARRRLHELMEGEAPPRLRRVT